MLPSQSRHNFVYGEGNPNALVMLIGEGPYEQEDKTGRPFVGAAGQLLKNKLAAINLKRSDVYIANIVKCCPPETAIPKPKKEELVYPICWSRFKLSSPNCCCF